MKNVILATDVLHEELENIKGGKKVTVTYKDKDGKEYTVTYEWD